MSHSMPQRRSRAALQSAKRSGNVRTLLVALVANVVVAVAKLVAGLASGSTAMLAEAAHSFADSLNEILLGISLRHAQQPADAAHPFGHGRARFLWAFMAAISSFLIGGCLSIFLAIHQLSAGGEVGNTVSAWVVLLVSFGADGLSWRQGLRQAASEARERGVGVWHHLLRSSDPIGRAVVVEDSAALIGLALAAAGLLFSELSGKNTPDSVASLLIGVLLAFTAFGLAWPLADFLLGRSLPPDQVERLRAVLAASPAVQEVLSLKVVYTGPEEVVIAAKVHPSSRLTIDQLARAMDELDQALQAESPVVADVFLDVTAHRAQTRPTARESRRLDPQG